MNLRYLTWWVCLLTCLSLCACEGETISLAAPASADKVEVRMGLSVGEDSSADTRMTATNTQAGSTVNFLGLGNIHLVPFVDNSATPPIGSTSQRLKKTDPLMIFYDQTTSGNVRKIFYNTMLIPSGTSSFLVYARAPGGGEDAAVADKYAHGSLKPFGLLGEATDDNAGSIRFIPDLIADDADNVAAYDKAWEMAQTIVSLLTPIANASYTEGGQTVYWRDQTGNAQTVYSDFTNDGHVFSIASGSALKTKLEFIRDYANYNNAQLTAAIKAKASTALSNTNLNKWSSFGAIANMPSGLIAFKWDDAAHQFVALNNENSKGYLNPPIADRSTMVYPSELWYYANSKIKTATNPDLSEEDMKNIFINGNNWANVLTNVNFTPGGGGETVVNSQTKVVAIESTLNYGVSRLMTSIKTRDGNIPVDPEGTTKITNSTIQWKGLLVTNQHTAGYDFQAVDDGHRYMVYDANLMNSSNNTISLSKNSLLPSNAATVTSNNGIHTLLVPSLDNEKVYLIAELYNNNANITIKGNGGCVIPPQSYFYMVGELDPSEVTPPAGSPASGDKVFESDLCTKVDGVIINFDGAYNYVPDLSSPALVLGLKIDLSWQQTEPRSVWLH